MWVSQPSPKITPCLVYAPLPKTIQTSVAVEVRKRIVVQLDGASGRATRRREPGRYLRARLNEAREETNEA